MNKLEEKMKQLLSERETIMSEMSEIKKAFDLRQDRLIEIIGSIKTLEELLNDEKKDDTTKK